MSETLTIALIGCGQIGGSLALALKSSQAALRIIGYDSNPNHAHTLANEGAIDAVALRIADAVKTADILVLATPLRSYHAIISEAAPYLSAHTIITDVGSVKGTLSRLGSLLPANIALVPAHPISGSEQAGPSVARGDLFKDKLCVLTPEHPENDANVTIIQHLWEAAGATVRFMPTLVHDQLYAYVSHLPHVIAFVAARQFHALHVRISKDTPILARFLRISRSNPRMWTDVFLENRDALLQSFDMFLAVLAHMESELRTGEQTSPTTPLTEIAIRSLPHLLASSLISTVSLYEQQSGVIARNFSAGGLRDIASPAAESPEDTAAFVSQHATQVAGLLAATIGLFGPLRAAIDASDEAALLALLEAMQAEATAINHAAH